MKPYVEATALTAPFLTMIYVSSTDVADLVFWIITSSMLHGGPELKIETFVYQAAEFRSLAFLIEVEIAFKVVVFLTPSCTIMAEKYIYFFSFVLYGFSVLYRFFLISTKTMVRLVLLYSPAMSFAPLLHNAEAVWMSLFFDRPALLIATLFLN